MATFFIDAMVIHNLLQYIFDSSLTPWFWLNRSRNFIKISITTTKPQNQKMHASPTLKSLSMLQYSQSFECVLIYFVSHKIVLKKLSGTFFRIRLSLLEAEICFLWCHFAGYSLYIYIYYIIGRFHLLLDTLLQGVTVKRIGSLVLSS